MVEPGRSAAVREAKKSTSSTTTMKKKKLTAATKADKDKKSSSKERLVEGSSKKQSCTAESPSYRLALKSLFSCRNSHAAQHQHQHPPESTKKCKKQLGCSSASICKLKDSSPRVMHRPASEVDAPATAKTAAAGEPCKRRASVSGACSSSSERLVKKPLSEVGNSKLHGGSLSSTSSSSSTTTGGSSFRAGKGKGMQLRRLSGCYECHMVVDPISGVFRDSGSMRATIFSCPDCAEIFVRAETLHLHQSIRHAVSELGPEDTSRNIIEIIFQSSWLKKLSPVCVVDRILKVHNAPATLSRFEDYRDAVKARASGLAGTGRRHPRCTADGNELLRFHCATLACSLGLHGATHLCDSSSCAACSVIRDGFKTAAPAAGVRTMATSGRAHDAVEGHEVGERRAMLVCRVIAGRVKRAQETETETAPAPEEEYDSVAGSAGVYSSLDELEVFNPRAILPCFVVVYKA